MGRPPSCLCGKCRKCKQRIYMCDWYQRKTPAERRAWVERRDPEKSRAADRARYHRDKPKRAALVQAYRKRYPEKLKAHQAISNAVRDGKLIRGPCAVCEVERDERGRGVHGHHYLGYTDAHKLDVIWLCQRHHTAAHREETVNA